MRNYQNGQIYTIRNRTDETLIYVGSTTMTLSKRMAEHRYASYTNNIKILYSCVNGNWDDWYIELYEVYPCENKQELCKREGEITREIGTLNYEIAGRTRKEWRYDNKDKISEQQKQLYEANKEKRLIYQKQYYNNKKKITQSLTERIEHC